MPKCTLLLNSLSFSRKMLFPCDHCVYDPLRTYACFPQDWVKFLLYGTDGVGMPFNLGNASVTSGGPLNANYPNGRTLTWMNVSSAYVGTPKGLLLTVLPTNAVLKIDAIQVKDIANGTFYEVSGFWSVFACWDRKSSF